MTLIVSSFFFNNCTEIKRTVLKNQKKCEYVTKINNWSAKALNISTSKDVKLQSHFKQPYNWSIYFMMEWLNFYCAIVSKTYNKDEVCRTSWGSYYSGVEKAIHPVWRNESHVVWIHSGSSILWGGWAWSSNQIFCQVWWNIFYILWKR